ncbi:MAG: TetR/AcrR family transcriptional regulator [Bdellovibrionales bacterium]|nr:TetR/AcrR family transcriptional regulator [Bdellovibrionales bacterium]
MGTKSNSDTKRKALDLAQEYLQTLGFNGFSFQTIADALGIKKASLHYYFSSKEEMGLAIMHEYEEGHKVWAEKVKDLPANLKLEKMIKGFSSLSKKNYMICPVGSFSTDFNSSTPKLQAKVKKFHIMIRDWLIETINQGKSEEIIKKNLDAEVGADLFLATLQGAVQVARVRGEQESLKQMLDLMLDNLYGK